MSERRRLESVRSGIDPKRRALGDEHAAFETFRSRLTELVPFEPALGPRRQRSELRRVSTSRIETIYRETVMGVPHYQAWYNHTYVRSVTKTLGSTLATTLVEASDVAPPVLEGITAQVSDCMDKRDAMIDAIDRERAIVATVADWLAEGYELLDRQLSGGANEQLQGRHRRRLDRLARVWNKCERAIERRRQHLRRCRQRDWPGPAASCRAFLYQQYDTNYPVLGAITRLGQSVERRRKQLQQLVGSGQARTRESADSL